MDRATLTIKLLATGQELTETFEHEQSGEAWRLGRVRAKQLQAEGYELEEPDGAQSLHPCLTTLREG